jgi:hypothetical protein
LDGAKEIVLKLKNVPLSHLHRRRVTSLKFLVPELTSVIRKHNRIYQEEERRIGYTLYWYSLKESISRSLFVP